MLVSSIVATTADTEGLMSYNFLLYYRKLIFYIACTTKNRDHWIKSVGKTCKFIKRISLFCYKLLLSEKENCHCKKLYFQVQEHLCNIVTHSIYGFLTIVTHFIRFISFSLPYRGFPLTQQGLGADWTFCSKVMGISLLS